MGKGKEHAESNRITQNSAKLLRPDGGGYQDVTIVIDRQEKHYLARKTTSSLVSKFGTITSEIEVAVIIGLLNGNKVLPLSSGDRVKRDYLVSPSEFSPSYGNNSILKDIQAAGFDVSELPRDKHADLVEHLLTTDG